MSDAVVGGYRIVRKLGEGGMGVVYLAVHATLGHEVAIKLLLPELSRNPEVVQRFFNEARAATQLTHPGIVRVFDFGTLPDGAAYFVMEMLSGESLGERLRNRRLLTGYEAMVITRQAAGALGAAHDRAIIHRDIKPDNLFLVPDPDMPGGERVKVLDFGIAKLAGDLGSLVRTRTGSVMGTPYYMSPEQCRGVADLDARADIYSLGCVLFEMTCGRAPFLGEGVGEILGAHQFVPAPDPLAMNPALPPVVAQIIRQAMAKQPRERQQSMRELADQCAAAMTAGSMPVAVSSVGDGTTLSGATGATHASPSARRTWPWIAGIGGVVAAGGAIAILAFGGETADEAKTPTGARDPVRRDPLPATIDAGATVPAGWALVRAATPPMTLGVQPARYPGGKLSDEVRGFRPERGVRSPTESFLIQARELTWGELGAIRPELVPADARAELPAVAISWTDAMAACAAGGGTLPTEEQWELAARGAEGRPHPWGDKRLDLYTTRAFAGPDGVPAAGGTSSQDRTPDGIADLAGNVQEWTADLWREDAPGEDESWVQAAGVTFRAIRGLPLAEAPPATMPVESGAYREPLCATGACPDDTVALLSRVGFRCVRPWRE